MEELKMKNSFPRVSFTGPITVHGPIFDIHDNQHIHFNVPQPDSEKDATLEEPSNVPSSHDMASSVHTEELFHFVHPSVESKDEWRIHDEVKRLVRRNGIQEICQYLKDLKRDKKILLPQSPSIAYAELIRLGMPKGGGFNEITFRKYYRD